MSASGGRAGSLRRGDRAFFNRPSGRATKACARSCAIWRISVAGSVIAACTSCCGGTASRSTARRRSGLALAACPHVASPALSRERSDRRRRKGRKRAVGCRGPAPVPALPNQRWSLDFVHDQMATGRRFRVLNVVDDVTRECVAAVPDTSISGKRVVRS